MLNDDREKFSIYTKIATLISDSIISCVLMV